MTIEEAQEKDIPEIVKVLKASLGEKDLLLSEATWRYKHIDNPFGKSIVLIAKEDGVIIGVRAFMRWEWKKNGRLFKALRAVDTATHPNHQGKGIFKKLTLEAVGLAETFGDHFIFNTPNDQSRPGYLKMGWEKVGKIHVGIKPSFGFLYFFKSISEYQINKNLTEEDLVNLTEEWNIKRVSSRKIFTPKSPVFLKWRYENNPLQKYEVIAKNNLYVAYYIKSRGRLKELRVSECIYSDIQSWKEVKSLFATAEKNYKVHVVSFTPELNPLWGKKGSFGPILTLRNLNLNINEKSELMAISNWNNSLGDLELY
ncbi:GNAT family N-acetyltransferase [Christiangramia salexigens]|uniref:N-acetyltransferase domain-containing protein n=1 Tax=Christiangramia salexigens TaxID=1913577 RepID=A0A1L3J2D0_9FLAO|nr:GNAT family N-acetyltransferase [Christiangramia salexigens]APG59277.1 hypothetical protein LPB144_02115 [Christiangramia salexigens]